MSEFTKEDFRATLDQYSKENDIAIHLELYDELIARDAALRLRCEAAEAKLEEVQYQWRKTNSEYERVSKALCVVQRQLASRLHGSTLAIGPVTMSAQAQECWFHTSNR